MMLCHTISKWASRLLFIMLLVVWVNQTFARPDDRPVDVDPIIFTVITKKVSVAIGEEFDLMIQCQRRSLIDSRLAQEFSDTDYRVKMVFPEGFEQTGGDYYDFIGGRLLRPGEQATYLLRGKFLRIPTSGKFLLLRGTRHSIDLNRFVLRGEVEVKVTENEAGSGLRTALFSQCLEAETMAGANGPVTSDPNASGGQTRGAENQYNHYVDYPINAPAAGTYNVSLRYYSSAAPTVLVQVNGGSNQTIALPNSGSWNIVSTEKTFTVNLTAGANTVRIAGAGGGSCRQDKVCVSGTDAQCQTPAAPAISKTSGTTVCAANNQSVVLSANGCAGTVGWFKDGAAIGSGTQITRTDAGLYTATCTVNGCTSAASSGITVAQSGDCGQSLSRCLEAENMNGATGPITSDPNASGGKTRGAENQPSHYVDYVLNNVPAAGTYAAKLQYYSSSGPQVNVTVNGVSVQNTTLPSSGSWNIVNAEYTFNLNLKAGSNTIRITGTGGGSCRQDKMCVSGNAVSPCQVLPNAPVISKTTGTTVCPTTNQTVTLTATSFTGTVTWFKNGVQIGAGTSITRNDAGNYTATCTANGCTSAASAALAVAETTGCGNNVPGLNPKISATGFPEMLTLSIVADPNQPGSWLISDLGTVAPPPGYEWSYFVGNKWIKKSGNLTNEPWQTNNPGRVVKMATKIGLDTLNRWPCPPDGCGGYYQNDAVASLGAGMRGGLTTFIFN